MKLSDFLSQAGGHASLAPTKPVKFKVLGRNQGGEQVVADAEAILVFVSEKERQEAIRDAHQELRRLYDKMPVPDERLSDEISYQLLFRALRDSTDQRVAFAGSVPELRAAMSLRVCSELVATYHEWVAQEFPEEIDEEQFQKLVEEAKKVCFFDLVSAFGSRTIQRAMPSLLAISG